MSAGSQTLVTGGRRKAAIINLLFFNASAALVVVQGFLLPPLYVARIPMDLYGAWLATGNVIAWIELVDPGISALLQQRVAYCLGLGDRQQVGRAIGTGILISAVIALIPLLALPAGGFLGPFMGVDASAAPILARSFELAIVSLGLAFLAFGFNAVNLAVQLNLLIGIVQMASSIIGLLTTLIMLLRGFGLVSLPAGIAVRAVLLLVGNAGGTIWWCIARLRFWPTFDRGELRRMLGLTTYTFVGRLGQTLLDRSDALIVAKVLNPQAAASLVLTGRALEPGRMLAVRIIASLTPGVANVAGSGNRELLVGLVRRVTSTVAWIAVISAVGFVALDAPFMSVWVGSSLYAGIKVCAAQGAVMVMTLLVLSLSQMLYASGAIRETTRLNLIEAVIRIPLQLFLVRSLGLWGMPLAALITAPVVLVVGLLRAAMRHLGTDAWRALRSDLGRLAPLTIVGLGLAIGLARLLAHLNPAWTWTSFGVVATLAAVVLVSILAVADRGFREELRGAVEGARRLYRKRMARAPLPGPGGN